MEQVRFESKLIHPEVQAISRDSVKEALEKPRITRPYFEKYEYVALLGERAQQIADGAKPLVSLDSMITSDPQFVWKVAEREINEKKLAAFIIHRRFPDGTSEYWSASELTNTW